MKNIEYIYFIIFLYFFIILPIYLANVLHEKKGMIEHLAFFLALRKFFETRSENKTKQYAF